MQLLLDPDLKIVMTVYSVIMAILLALVVIGITW